MKKRIALWLRRWWIRRKIRLVDWIEGKCFEAQSALRNELASLSASAIAAKAPQPAESVEGIRPLSRRPESFVQWEARRSGIAPIAKPRRRRRGVSAAEFSRRFA